MKRNLFIVAAVTLMAMVSCNKDNIDNGGSQEPSYYVEFTAEIDRDNAAPAPANAQTRTSYDENNKKTLWLEDDLISVNGKRFKIAELKNGGLTARFVNDEELGEDFKAPFTAIYPYNETQGAAVIPAVQTVSEGTFADESVATVAYSAIEKKLSFKHVTSLLKFQVSASCETVTITSDDALAGTININSLNVTEGVTEIDYNILEEKTEVTVTGPFEVGKDYYVAVLPGVKNNFRVLIDGYFSKMADSVEPKRSVVMNMKTLPDPLRKIYVKNDLNWDKLSLYAWTDTDNKVIGSWPGATLSETEVIAGNTYYVYDFKDVAGTITGVIINGTASNGSNDISIQTSDIKDNLQGNKYYRLSIRDNFYKEIDPNDLTTFGFRIYVYMQNNSDTYVDPYLHIWSTAGITDTAWNNQKKITNKFEYPAVGNKIFYYYEPPTQAYSSMNFIVTLQNGGKQTGDIKGALKSDYYVCAWANNSTSYGLYARRGNVTKDNNDITVSYIGVDPELCY